MCTCVDRLYGLMGPLQDSYGSVTWWSISISRLQSRMVNEIALLIHMACATDKEVPCEGLF